jgi:hypothetical protein
MIKHILFDKSKVNLLAICCSFRRPKVLQGLIETFNDTKSQNTELLIYLHEDDKFLKEYEPITEKCNYIIDVHRMLCPSINHVVFNEFPEIPYYEIVNDDFRYRTKNWDEKLIKILKEKSNDIGFTCGADLINGGNWHKYEHPSAEIWSWKFVKALGYVYPPAINAFCADHYAKNIAKSLNALNYVPEVIIEHLWYPICGKQPDENIKDGYSEASQAYGHKAYNDWVRNDRINAIARVKKEFGII